MKRGWISRSALLSLALVLMLALAAGCGGGGDEPQTDPTVGMDDQTTDTVPATPVPEEPAEPAEVLPDYPNMDPAEFGVEDLALADAVATGRRRGLIADRARVLTDSVAAVSVGVVDGLPMLDLDYEMDLAADVELLCHHGADSRGRCRVNDRAHLGTENAGRNRPRQQRVAGQHPAAVGHDQRARRSRGPADGGGAEGLPGVGHGLVD